MIALRLLPIALAGAAVLTLDRQADAVFTPLVDPNGPGLAIMARLGGQTVLTRGYGLRDLRTSEKIDARTNFRLASFTKQFTAMAAMLLVRDGKLRYESRLTDVFPEFPEYGRPITVRHLLTHTSGLPDYEDLMEGGPWTAARQIQDREVLDLLEKQTKGKFAPSESWSYSNSAYVVLGLIVTKISGQPFEDFLARRVFEPLGMRDTLAYVKGKNSPPRRAFGHSLEAGRVIETDQSSTSATLGDGGVYSNLEDLAKWDDALARHTLLPADAMRPALEPVRLNDGSEPHWPVQPGEDNLAPGKPVSYGFGWFLDPYRGNRRMWHTGTTTGFRTAIERFPDRGATVVILCNRSNLDAAKLALQIADIVLERR